MNLSEKLKEMLIFDWAHIDAPLFSSLLIMLVLVILGVIVGIKAKLAIKKEGYKHAPRGILFWADAYYDYVTKFAVQNMGRNHMIWGGFFFTLFAYLFIAFNASLFGIPSLIDWLWAPLSLAIITFVLIHAVAIKYQHWSYFKRYIDPIPIFLPVNLITMWSPIISTTMRMFGNCLAGTVLITLIQWATSNLSASIFSSFGVSLQITGIPANWNSFFNSFPYWTGTLLSPIPMGVLNLYFSLFSGFIQTTVFASLTALWIAQEMPPEEDNVYVPFERVPADLLVPQGEITK